MVTIESVTIAAATSSHDEVSATTLSGSTIREVSPRFYRGRMLRETKYLSLLLAAVWKQNKAILICRAARDRHVRFKTEL